MNNPATLTKPGWTKRLRYKIDQQFSRHPSILILWLGLVSTFIIFLIGFILTLTGIAPADEPSYNFIEALWVGFLQMMGSGSIGGRETIWGYRMLMLGVALFNLFFFSIVIGALTSGMQNRLEELRRGRSNVVEKNHTVILGWSEQTLTVASELVRAHKSEPSSAIVILGEQEKAQIEDEIRQKIGDTGHVRIVCRTGSALEMTNLDLVSLNTSKNIIVMTPLDSPNPDAEVIKVVLAILNNPKRRPEPYRIVATIRNPHNTEIARVFGQEQVEWIQQGDVISRIIAQTALQPGLSMVYSELFDYSGNEIYLTRAPGLEGKTFGQAQLAAEHMTVIGMRAKDGKPRLDVPPDTLIEPGDQVIVIAQDDSSIAFQPEAQPKLHEETIQHNRPHERHPENLIMLGWNGRGRDILRELDHYVAPGSCIQVVADPALTGSHIEAEFQALVNLRATYRPGDTTSRQLLENLDLDNTHHLILLAYSEALAPQQADALTLMTLLHVRHLADTVGFALSIVTEMLDLRNSKLASSDRPDDFIVSDRLISLLMAQVAETRGMCSVYDEIFDPEGVEIYLKPAALYIQPGVEVNFYTLVKAAILRRELAIGYRIWNRSDPSGAKYQVVINPAKAAPLILAAEDQLIVLARSY